MSNQDPEYPSAEGPGQFEDPGIPEPDDDEGEPAHEEASGSIDEKHGGLSGNAVPESA